MPYNGPRLAITSVLAKLGIDPLERLDEFDQDEEYTACRSEELPRYFQLYSTGDCSPDERAVLCCFLLESINELIQNGRTHPLQEEVLTAILDAGEIHSDEVAYWMDTSDPDPDNWWPITVTLLAHKKR